MKPIVSKYWRFAIFAFVFSTLGISILAPSVLAAPSWTPRTPSIEVSASEQGIIPDNGTFQFGSQVVGNTQDGTLMISNKGKKVLYLSISKYTPIFGADRRQFTLKERPKTSLRPGETTQLVLEFRPTSIGEKNAGIMIATNDPMHRRYMINLQATALPVESFSVSGKATDPDGNPLADVTVRVTDTPRTVKTGDDGKFRFTNVQGGFYDITVNSDGYCMQTPQATDVFGNTFPVTSKYEDAIGQENKHGILELPLNGAPYVLTGGIYGGNCTIPFSQVEIELREYSNMTVTDEEGKFHVKDLSLGVHRLFVEKDGYIFEPNRVEFFLDSDIVLPGQPSPIDEASSGKGFFIGIKLVDITGTVNDENGTPLQDVLIGIVLAGDGKGAYQETTTDSSGIYHFSDLRPGSYWLNPSKESYVFEPQRILVEALSSLTQYFFASLVPEVIYEDAQDMSTARWKVVGNGTVENIDGWGEGDGQRVISLTTTPSRNASFTLYKPDGGDWNNTTHKFLQWDIKKMRGTPMFYVTVETTVGERILLYSTAYTTPKTVGKYLIFPLEKEVADGTWHTVRRDLEADIKSLLPQAGLTMVKRLMVRGNVQIDNVLLRAHPVVATIKAQLLGAGGENGVLPLTPENGVLSLTVGDTVAFTSVITPPGDYNLSWTLPDDLYCVPIVVRDGGDPKAWQCAVRSVGESDVQYSAHHGNYYLSPDKSNTIHVSVSPAQTTPKLTALPRLVERQMGDFPFGTEQPVLSFGLFATGEDVILTDMKFRVDNWPYDSHLLERLYLYVDGRLLGRLYPESGGIPTASWQNFPVYLHNINYDELYAYVRIPVNSEKVFTVKAVGFPSRCCSLDQAQSLVTFSLVEANGMSEVVDPSSRVESEKRVAAIGVPLEGPTFRVATPQKREPTFSVNANPLPSNQLFPQGADQVKLGSFTIKADSSHGLELLRLAVFIDEKDIVTNGGVPLRNLKLVRNGLVIPAWYSGIVPDSFEMSFYPFPSVKLNPGEEAVFDLYGDILSFIANPSMTIVMPTNGIYAINASLGNAIEEGPPSELSIQSLTTVSSTLTISADPSTTLHVVHGQREATLGVWNFAVGPFEDIQLTSIPFSVPYSGEDEHLRISDNFNNLKFYINGQLSSPVIATPPNDRTITIPVTPSLGILPKGQTSRIELKGDISSNAPDAGKTFALHIKTGGVQGYGVTSMQRLAPTPPASVFAQPITIHATGTLAINRDAVTNVQSSDVVRGTRDVLLGAFRFDASYEDMSIRSITVRNLGTSVDGLTEVKLYTETGEQLGRAIFSGDSARIPLLPNRYVIPANSSKIIFVRGNTNPFAMLGGTLQVTLENIEFNGVASGAAISTTPGTRYPEEAQITLVAPANP